MKDFFGIHLICGNQLMRLSLEALKDLLVENWRHQYYFPNYELECSCYGDNIYCLKAYCT